MAPGIPWCALALVLGDVDGDGNDEMVAAFDRSDRAELFRSDTGYLDPMWWYTYWPPVAR